MNKVYYWGLLAHLKSGKNNAVKQPIPLRIKIGKGKNPIAVQSSTHSFYVLTEKGEILSFGVKTKISVEQMPSVSATAALSR